MWNYEDDEEAQKEHNENGKEMKVENIILQIVHILLLWEFWRSARIVSERGGGGAEGKKSRDREGEREAEREGKGRWEKERKRERGTEI